MNKSILIILVTTCCTYVYAAERVFWSHGSAIYTNHALWLKKCNTESIDGKKYRIGTDIVACITKTANGKPKDLIMCNAKRFSKKYVSKMRESTENSLLPSRKHSRFKCLSIRDGWVC